MQNKFIKTIRSINPHVFRSVSGVLKFVILLLIAGFLTTCYCQSQEPSIRTVTGRVAFAEDNQPVPGANVIIKGTSTGTVTDINGNFSISVKSGDVLVISFLGYNDVEITVANQTQLDVSLEEEVTKLDEVVVIGYGQMRRSDLTGSVVSVSSEEISKTVSTTFEQVLQGKAAGVEVTQNTGQPGGSVSVRIRGVNSLTGNNEPLYVIDGVPVEGYTGEIKYNNSIGNVLSTINPTDIVDMQILKDASATAIFGSRAANGVILITTSQGKAGEAKISYETYYGIQQLPNYIPTMNLREFAEYRNEKDEIVGHGARDEFADPSILGEGTNWQKEMFRNAPIYSHQISMTGGNEKTTYAASIGYFNQDGIAVGSNFERYTMKLRVDNQARNWLKIGTNILGSRSNQIITVEDRELIKTTLEQTPDVPLKNPDGSWGGPDENIYGTYVSNVVAEALLRENERKNSQIIASGYANIDLLKGLVFKTEVSGNISFSNKYYFEPTYQFGEVENVINSSERGVSNSLFWNINNYLTYSNQLGNNHNFILMLGHEASESNWESLSGKRRDFFTNSIHELDAGDFETAESYGSKGSNALESYFGRMNYSFADKYLLTATLRADGSSKFGPDKRWGYFPSFAFAWKIHKETFMNNISFINNLKLRLGWGMVGNQNISDYAYGSPLGNRPTVWGTGVLPQRIANPDVQWESTRASNIGLDLYMFQNRIEFIADAYIKQTDNLLMDMELPTYAGTAGGDYTGAIEPPVVNIGAIENKGFEFTLNTVNIDRSGFRWTTGLVFSLNRNEVKKMTTDSTVINKLVDGTILTRTRTGDPVGMFYGYIIDGMFNTADDFYMKDEAGNYVVDNEGNRVLVALPVDAQQVNPTQVWVGDYIFRDINGDTVITEADRTYIGNPNPKFTIGFNTGLTYKNFDLTVYLNGVYGNKLYNWTRREFEDPMSNRGVLKSVKDFARIGVYNPGLTTDPETGEIKEPDQIISNVYVINEGTEISRLTNYDANTNNRVSDRYIEDGSYLRIKNVVLGYTLPDKIVKIAKIERLRLYVNIQNLCTFTKYKGYDPDVGSINQDMLMTGIDKYRYPSQRIYTFGLNVNF
jgi:TonB-linked SusC/RagA family outer membrane protein